MKSKDLKGRELYRSITKGKVFFIIGLLSGIAILLIANIATGSSAISVPEILRVLAGGQGEGNQRMIIMELRLPMALMAVVVGASLGISGCEIQTILHNPLASPDTLGISSAASFGAALGLLIDSRILAIPSPIVVTGFSFIFALFAMMLVYGLSVKKGMGKNTIVLLGVAVTFLFNSLTMFLQYIADEDELQSLVFWNFGSLLKTTWVKVAVVAIFLLAGFILLSANAWSLTAMSLGDTKAQSLGVNVRNIRSLVILSTSLLSAVAVCFVGTIGFVGLIAPHIARILVGEEQRYFMPISALLGSFVVSAAFLLSKLIIPGIILPVGLVTSLIGIPFFFAIILKNREVL